MDIWTAIERVGFPITICIMLFIAAWRSLKWLGKNVVAPIATSHIALVDEVKIASKTNSETLAKVTEILAIKAKALTEIAKQNEEVVQLSKDANKKLDGIAKAIPIQTRQLSENLMELKK